LDRSQGFATIALYEGLTSASHDRRAVDTTRSEGASKVPHNREWRNTYAECECECSSAD
jgi:hypothetical protein